MRIGNEIPAFYIQNPVMMRFPAPSAPPVQQPHNNYPGISVSISQAAREAYEQSLANGRMSVSEAINAATLNALECATCDSRRYQDVSDDPSVSFQTPTHISPGQSASAVAAHEAEHVASERARAKQEGREIVSQTVRLTTAICPECGIIYVSGGETRTISREKVDRLVDIEA